MSRLSTVSLLGLLVVLAINLQSSECGRQSAVCPKENCVRSNMCEWADNGRVCENSADACCSILRSEFRTLCRHHGGECMKECGQKLQRNAVDCSAGEFCCVLVK